MFTEEKKLYINKCEYHFFSPHSFCFIMNVFRIRALNKLCTSLKCLFKLKINLYDLFLIFFYISFVHVLVNIYKVNKDKKA